MGSSRFSPDEIKMRAEAAVQKEELRKRDALLAWQAVEDSKSALRNKTDRLRAQRLAKEAEDARVAAAAPVVEKVSATRKRKTVAA